MRATVPSFLLPIALTGALRAANLVVDASGAPGTFPTVQAAVDAASDGDLILVHPGDYLLNSFGATVVSGKALTIVRDPAGGTRPIVPSFVVSGLASPKRLVVRGLTIRPPFLPPDQGTEVSASPGGVWFEDCSLDGPAGVGSFGQNLPGKPALAVSQATVTLVRCDLLGGDGAPGTFTIPASDAGPGIEVQAGGHVAVLEGSVTGGTGGVAPGSGFPGDGGAGARVTGGVVWFSGTTVQGGQPGGSFASGGPGLEADAASHVEALDTLFLGAAGAPPVQAPPGVLDHLPGFAREMEVESPVAPGQLTPLFLRGEPGDVAVLFFSPTMIQTPLFPAAGWLLVGPALNGPFVVGPLPAPTGDALVLFAAPPLVPPLVGRTDLAQAFFVDTTGAVVAGAPTAFVLWQ